jgi:signal transduction histidine kinase
MYSQCRRMLAAAQGRAAENEHRLNDNNEANSYLQWARTLTEEAQARERGAALLQALQLVERAFGDSPQTLSVFWQVSLLDTRVSTLLELDRPEEALRHLEEVLRLCGDRIADGSYFWACIQILLAEIELKSGRAEAASVLQRLERAAAVEHAELQTGPMRSRILAVLAQASELAGDAVSALSYHKLWSQRELASRSQLAAARVEALDRNQSALRGEVMEFILHDLRSPLAAALAALETGGVGLPHVAQAIRKSLRVTDSALGIMRAEYLDVSELKPLDLGGLVDDVCEDRRIDAGARLVRCVTLGLEVRGDPALLTRAIDNIVSNALQHTPVAATVTVRVEQDDDEVVLTVADEGPGIPNDVRRALFRRYAAGRASAGQGLGLALVSRVVRLHDARIEVVSSEGAGTTLTLRFPRHGARAHIGSTARGKSVI